MATGISVAASASAQTAAPSRSAREAAELVSNKLSSDTRFTLELVPQKEELGMQVIDFRHIINAKKQSAFALRTVNANVDTLIRFGISHAANATVWINGKQCYNEYNKALQMPGEHAYNRFIFQRYFTARVVKGLNEIKIRYHSSSGQAVVFLRPQAGNGDLNTAIRFENTPSRQWRLTGPFSQSQTVAVRGEDPYIVSNGKYYSWQSLPQRMIPQLKIDSALTYFRDPYLDWNYSNGNAVWASFLLAKVNGEREYRYVKRYTDFMLTHLEYFRRQYDSLFVLRGSFHRFFRMSMLDDAGSSVLPFLELYQMNHDENIRKKILEPVADYILHKQVRLPDGIFCRPEPVEFTVWCDDLFMSVPFLLRWAKITGNSNYYDEAVKQFRGFRKYLLDAGSNLYHHGWFSNTQQKSPVCWGRANGWIAWATLELLDQLPPSHKAYNEIREAFRSQLTTLKKYQEPNGAWHQVLDKPASFEETSCTAMFTMAMAKGVRMGWLDNSFRDAALRGWQAVNKKIDRDGTVHDICRGTEIGFDDNFYFTRQRFNQDPRGLGAVIMAGLEVSLLGNY